MKIMIVDDHPAMRRILRQIVLLAATEVEVEECESGETAITQYAVINPDLVLMDIELKSMSGLRATEEIYKQDDAAKVVLVTSHDTPTFRRQAKKLNVYGFVAKDNLTAITPLIKTITKH